MSTPDTTLDNAKDRLRQALTRLEQTVETKVKDAQTIQPSGTGAEQGKETAQLQATIRKLSDDNQHLRVVQAKASKRVNGLIRELKEVIGK